MCVGRMFCHNMIDMCLCVVSQGRQCHGAASHYPSCGVAGRKAPVPAPSGEGRPVARQDRQKRVQGACAGAGPGPTEIFIKAQRRKERERDQRSKN